MLTDEVKTKFEATSSLIDADYTIIRGRMPELPNEVVALFETGGTGQSRTFDGGVVEEVGLQVVVRGGVDQYDEPRLQAERIYQTLAGWGAFTVSSVRYLNFDPLQAPFPLGGRDGNKRQSWAMNFLVQKELSSAS